MVAVFRSDTCNNKLLLNVGGVFVKLTAWSKTMLVKVKFTLEQAMKSQGGSRGIAVLFL
jgi:hypothetical protein